MKIEKEVTSIDSVIDSVIHKIYMAADHPFGVSGIASGFHELDVFTSGWHNSDLIILASYPYMGNTRFMLSMALNIAVENKTQLAIISLKYSNEKLVQQMLVSQCKIDKDMLMKGRLSEKEWDKLTDFQAKLYEAPICLYDAPNISMEEISDKAHKLVIDEEIEILFIDNLQMIRSDGLNCETIEQENITKLKALKILARELDIPVIVLSDLKMPENTQSKSYGKRPELLEFHELDMRQNEADTVCLLYRPEYFHITEDEDGNSTLGTGELIVYNGHSGSKVINLQYNVRFGEFSENENTEEKSDHYENKQL